MRSFAAAQDDTYSEVPEIKEVQGQIYNGISHGRYNEKSTNSFDRCIYLAVGRLRWHAGSAMSARYTEST